MLDPFSALNVATSVVQFVDFGTKLLSGAHQLRISANGQLYEHTLLQTITQSLLEASTSFKNRLAQDNAHSLSPHEKDLQSLCEECTAVAGHLMAALEKLKLGKNNGKMKSMQQVLKIMWNQAEIQELKGRLDAFRQQLIVVILIALREPVASLKQDQLEISSKMDHISKQNDSLGQQFLAHVASQKVEKRQQLEASSAIQRDAELNWAFNDEHSQDVSENLKWRSDLIEAVQGSYEDRSTEPGDKFHDSVLAPVYRGRCAKRFASKTLRNLQFDEMPSRHERISETYKKTYEWIFESRPDTKISWSNFVEWLQNDASIYWITGKPGAGKSTLMKFIYDDRRTRLFLARGEPKCNVVVAGFFFWNSGTPIQMSQEGLVRTLLYDVLQQCTDLLPFLFPDRWEAHYLFDQYIDYFWTWTDLIRTLKAVIKEGSRTRRFAFFIDGLDEFGGNHSELLKLIFSLVDHGKVKMCVASRPWTVFEDTFSRSPSLMLQDLTYPDIKHYVSTKLYQNPGFASLMAEEAEYSSSLVMDIVEKSSGVFLWVVLVVASLTTGITNGDRISDLQERVDALPVDLEDLFTKILDSLEPSYRRHASELFRLVRASKGPLPLHIMAFADSVTVDATIERSIDTMSSSELNSKAERMRRRLNSRCKGLLENVTGARDDRSKLATHTVQYLHRTVKDYMEKAENWAKIDSYSGDDYNPHIRLACAYLLQMKTAPKLSQQQFWDNVIWCLEYTVPAVDLSKNKSSASTATRVLDCLDESADIVSRSERSGPSLLKQCTISASPVYWTKIPQRGRSLAATDFFSLAIMYQIEWYVREKIKSGYLASSKPSSLPPLICAVDHTPGSLPLGGKSSLWRSQPSQVIIELLLNAGLDPNEKYEELTPWTSVVLEMQRGSKYQPWIDIGELFLKHGADVQAEGVEDIVSELYPEYIVDGRATKPTTLSPTSLLEDLKGRSMITPTPRASFSLKKLFRRNH
ncbi:hypothetical protein G7Y89_g12817 [Cudoniella acicularis]|uniref:NACHT domain-containing protein n=1 Tax=Cudoniella acicularis TaxID=354080 RepID=A0A8H4VYT5_9HELO|nr:hypothetical protein G7Y89_g12817 [Cudoniella acicularis]